MPTYQEFAKKARERFQANNNTKESNGEVKKKSTGPVTLTRHAEYKMKQYGLSLQKVRGVIRRPYRTETGVAAKTVAVMQPVSPKKEAGSDKEIWKQEIWVMYQKTESKNSESKSPFSLESQKIKIISAWRYPGISPKRDPIPDDIWQELVDQNILEDN
jgi:hypothetical protein